MSLFLDIPSPAKSLTNFGVPQNIAQPLLKTFQSYQSAYSAAGTLKRFVTSGFAYHESEHSPAGLSVRDASVYIRLVGCKESLSDVVERTKLAGNCNLITGAFLFDIKSDGLLDEIKKAGFNLYVAQANGLEGKPPLSNCAHAFMFLGKAGDDATQIPVMPQLGRHSALLSEMLMIDPALQDIRPFGIRRFASLRTFNIHHAEPGFFQIARDLKIEATVGGRCVSQVLGLSVNHQYAVSLGFTAFSGALNQLTRSPAEALYACLTFSNETSNHFLFVNLKTMQVSQSGELPPAIRPEAKQLVEMLKELSMEKLIQAPARGALKFL
jgi:hypothetical protein